MRVSTLPLIFSIAWLPAALADDADQAVPSLELLEFLADYEKQDDEWIGPMEILNMSKPEPSDAKAEESNDE